MFTMAIAGGIEQHATWIMNRGLMPLGLQCPRNFRRSAQLRIILFLAVYLMVSPSVAKGGELSAKAIIGEMQAKYSQMTDYQCILETYETTGEKTTRDTMGLYFKKPKLIRMEIFKGTHKDSEAIYRDNKVRGHKGGFFGFVWMTLKADEKMAKSIRGNRMDESDWGAIVNTALQYLEKGEVKLLGQEKRDDRQTYLMEMAPKDSEIHESITKERIWVDVENKIPIKYTQYEAKDELVLSKTYRDMEIDVGLKEELFSFK